ncbi:MAG TPA: DUF6766 family protein [Gemmatimonadota bacterium]|nr:DUF6766 family protein [Gemmatimonadota bacterium]
MTALVDRTGAPVSGEDAERSTPWLRNSKLAVACFAIFAVLLVAQSLTGWRERNNDAVTHHEATISYGEYLTTGHFYEATFENWESEFLQMAAYVVLTIGLRQKGSAESKKLEGREKVDADPRLVRDKKDAPWPVRRGGFVLTLYEHSLGIAFALLFLLSFVAHAMGGAAVYSHEQVLHGGDRVTALEYLGTSRLWFESFQNWQSEFLAVGSIVVLSIFLRQRGSPESKPVAAPHAETGG